MNIRINNDYKITSDENNFILNKVRVRLSGDNEGEEYSEAISYHRSLKALLGSLREREIRLSEASTFDELLTDVRTINKKIAEIE